MQKRRKINKTQGKSYKLLSVFLLLLSVLLVLSITLKIIAIIAKSGFDGKHRYTILLMQSSTSWQVVSFSPEDNSISILNITSSTPVNFAQTFEIPVNTTVTSPRFSESGEISWQLLSLLPRAGLSKKNFTIFDIARLSLFANGASKNNLTTANISYPLSTDEIDKVSYPLIKEDTVNTENINVQIINATGETGVGTRLARFLNNAGVNVVQVKTATNIIKHSQIAYSSDSSYTFSYITDLLNYPLKKMQNTGISDIIITIGQDGLSGIF